MNLKSLRILLQNVQKNRTLIDSILETNKNFDILFIQKLPQSFVHTILSLLSKERDRVVSAPNYLTFFVVIISFLSYQISLDQLQNIENLKFFTFPDYIDLSTLLLWISAILENLFFILKTPRDISDLFLIESFYSDNTSNFISTKCCQ